VGYAQILTVALIIFYLLRKQKNKEQKRTIFAWLILLCLSLFFITPYSTPIWKIMPFISDSGSQRLLIAVAFYISLLAGYVVILNKKRTWLIYGLIIFAIGTTILNWGQRRVIPTIDDAMLRSDLSLGTKWADTHFYALPKWINPKQEWFAKIPNSHIEILQGQGTIKTITRTSTLHKYEINATTSLKLKENTLYFPGWTATLNNKPVLLKPDSNGVILLNLSKGQGELKVSYHDLYLFQLSKIISLLSMLLIFTGSLLYFAVKKFRPNSKALDRG
jgi:hypothetical protein